MSWTVRVPGIAAAAVHPADGELVSYVGGPPPSALGDAPPLEELPQARVNAPRTPAAEMDTNE
jgi:hypothetical protein